MRIAVLILILANFAVFAWLKWASPTNAAPDSGLEPAAPAATRLVLFPVDTSKSAGRAPVCLRFGPVANATAATALAMRLGGAGYSVRDFAQTRRTPDVWQVLLAGFDDTAAAQRAQATLRKGGVRDSFVQAGDGKGASLSLGLFRDLDHAYRRAGRVRTLGFQPQIQVRLRTETHHYIEIAAPANATAAIRKAGGPVPVERAACAMPPAPASAFAGATDQASGMR